VAIPTETVYGLGAHALDAQAVARIFEAKARPAWNPLIVHVANQHAARALVANWPEQATQLADAFWPGPLTLVLTKASHVPDIVTAGGDTIALRIPAHEGALALLRACALPIAAPSANRFTELSPTTAQHVADGLGERVGMILDGGPCTIGVESTVLDLSGERPVVLRPGHITAEQIAEVLGEPVRKRSEATSASKSRTAAPTTSHTTAQQAASSPPPQKSPGMAARHYAPKTPVWLASEADVDDISRALAQLQTDPVHRFGLLALQGGLQLEGAHWAIRLPRDPVRYARALYAALHELDRADCQVLIVERPPDEPHWDAVNDRLLRSTRESA
jgi:L-threonylcarbamoyladenylate synthase